MIQFQDYKHSPEYLNFEKSQLKFGEKEIYIYHLEFPIYSQFSKKGFQLRVLDDTGSIINCGYYESYGYFREYGMVDHHFVFDMKILPNNDNTLFIDPPGSSILDHFKQLFYYTYFLLSGERADLIQEMIEQLRFAIKGFNTQLSP